jgi:hypothetical protein
MNLLLKKIINKIKDYPKIRADYKLFELEDAESKVFLEKNNKDIFLRFEKSLKDSNYSKNYWSISPSSLRYFIYYLEESFKNEKTNIVEFGSGQSTMLWDKFINEEKDLKVTTYEHDKSWFDSLNKSIKNVSLIYRDLKQIDDDNFVNSFKLSDFIKSWEKIGVKISDSEYKNTRIKNTFYDISVDDIDSLGNISGLILDGPHGNGRALAFPLLLNSLNTGTIVLIDDFDHYPFIDLMQNLFEIEILNKCTTIRKRWILVKVKSRKI